MRNGRKVLIQPVSFLLRRSYFAYLLVIGTPVFIYQFQRVLTMTLLSALVPYFFDTFERQSERKMVVLHETVIATVSYCFLFFKMASSVEDNFKLGYAPIGILCLYICICLLMSFWLTVSTLRYNIRLHLVRRKFLKSRN